MSDSRGRPYPPVRPPVRPGGGGAGKLGGILGGLGGALTCLCCLSALGLIGLWAAFIPFVSFFKYAYDQDVRAFGGNANIQSLQQVVFLLAICLLTIRFVNRQITT